MSHVVDNGKSTLSLIDNYLVYKPAINAGGTNISAAGEGIWANKTTGMTHSAI